MTSVQEYLLKLLYEVDQICAEHNIDYYMFAGSMLGVERNEGFLPWDDDVDIIMTKENYDRFSEIMRTNPPDNRVFECIERNKDYPLQFGKYISTDTTGITRSLAFGNSSAGLWIDIIYVAPLPTSQRKIKKIKKWFSCYCELENEVYIEHKNHYKGFYWRYKLGLFLISIFGKDRVIKHLKKWFDGFSAEECTQYFMYHSLFTDFRAFDKQFFEKPVRRNYGGIEVSVSPYNREFSRVLYGDSWMIVPDVSQQEVHTMVLDFDMPYTKYVDDYMVFLDKEEIAETVRTVKQLQMKNLELLRTSVKDRNHLEGLLLNEKMKKQIRDTDINLRKLVDDQNYDVISDLYNEYLDLQFDSDVLFWKVFIALDDELLYPVLMKLTCFDSQYYKAERILQLRQQIRKDSPSKDLENVQALIDICRDLSIALWDKQDYDLVKKVLMETNVKEKFPFCFDVELCDCYISVHEAKSRDDYCAVKQRLQNLLKKNPKQGECIKLLGDIELEIGNRDQALMYYDEAETLTRNGLVLLDIQKKKEAYGNED